MSFMFAGHLGEQVQHPTLKYPGLHFGYTMAPFFSQPCLLSFSHRLYIPLSFSPSPNFHGYPAPRPYGAGLKQYAPSFLKPDGHGILTATPRA